MPGTQKKKLKVLIVDDEPFIRQILSRIVAREGYLVSEAVDGQDAIEKLAEQKQDFVISDIKMPRMDGLQLLAIIKEKYPDIRVLLVTAFGSEYSFRDILDAGADHYIAKPFKNFDIAKTLSSLANYPPKKIPAASIES